MNRSMGKCLNFYAAHCGAWIRERSEKCHRVLSVLLLLHNNLDSLSPVIRTALFSLVSRHRSEKRCVVLSQSARGCRNVLQHFFCVQYCLQAILQQYAALYDCELFIMIFNMMLMPYCRN